jgi:uncharacterized membrane protein YkoI
LHVVSRALFYALLLVCAVVAGSAAALLTAAAAPLQPAASALVMPRGSLSMDQAVRMVEERYHARVVKAQTERDEGRTLYVLRLLNDAGRVWTVRVDAASGEVQ